MNAFGRNLAAVLMAAALFGCASTGKQSRIGGDGIDPGAGKRLETAIRYYRQGDHVKSAREFDKFFAEMNINARVEFTDIIEEEEYKEQIVKEYIDRIEPRLISREQSIQSLFTQGMTLYEAGQYKSAIEFFVKVMVLDYRHSEAMKYINLSNMKLTEMEREENRKKVGEYYDKAMEYYNGKDLEHAAVELRKVLKLDPKHAEAKRYYDEISAVLLEKAKILYEDGLDLYSAGDVSSAVEMWEKALRLAPDFKKAQKALERAKTKLD